MNLSKTVKGGFTLEGGNCGGPSDLCYSVAPCDSNGCITESYNQVCFDKSICSACEEGTGSVISG